MTDFARTRALFRLPEGVVYLDGNSLGPLPIAAKERVAKMLGDEWGQQLIRGWNSAGWFVQPRRVGDRIGRLIGAPEGTVVMGDTLSIKVYQALASALAGGWIAPNALVVVEEAVKAAFAPPEGFDALERRSFDDTELSILRRASLP